MGVARKQYNYLWNHYVARRVGAQGQLPPQLNWGAYPGTGTNAVPSENPIGQRPVYLTNAIRKMLKNPMLRSIGQHVAVHEMRHVYQDLSNYDSTLPHDQRPEEIDAENFANGVVSRVKKDHRRHVRGLPPISAKPKTLAKISRRR